MNKRKALLLALLILPILFFTVSYAYAQTVNKHPKDVPSAESYWCSDCHLFEDPPGTPITTPTNKYWVRTEIDLKDPGHPVTVTIDYPHESTTQVNLAPDYDGPCEACHFDTEYHCNSDDCGVIHDELDHTHEVDNPDKNCVDCHAHFQEDMFGGALIGPQSHETHLATYADLKGPAITAGPWGTDCERCHYPDPGGGTDYTKFGATGVSLDDTDVCDFCHSLLGAYDGVGKTGPDTDLKYLNWVAYGAKFNWRDGIYTGDATALKDGKERWCAGCHDDLPSLIEAVLAPKVIGDSGQTYGFYATGHGREDGEEPPDRECVHCHAVTGEHIDGVQRTYQASLDNYKQAYRLNEDLAVPRTNEPKETAFSLCTQSNCHILGEILSNVYDAKTDFRYETHGDQLHTRHLDSDLTGPGDDYWDSDWDAHEDSVISCTACHNVHGSSTHRMTRDGELIGHAPALDFKWYLEDGTTETDVYEDSRWGGMIAGGPFFGPLEDRGNRICDRYGVCHNPLEAKYYRTPGGREQISFVNVWTSDVDNGLKIKFYCEDDVRYNVTFRIGGPGTYWVKTSIDSKAYSTSGPYWETPIYRGAYLPAGVYHWSWDKTIPSEATETATAKVVVRLRMYDEKPSLGGTELHRWNKAFPFNIIEKP